MNDNVTLIALVAVVMFGPSIIEVITEAAQWIKRR